MTPDNWPLREANIAEVARIRAKLMRVGLLTMAGGVSTGLAATLLLNAAGAPELGLAVFVACVGLAAIAVHGIRRRLTRPIESSILIAWWLAKEGLVDADGRLTEAGLRAAQSPMGDSREPFALPGNGGEAIALSAYVAAYHLWRERQSWPEPFADAVERIDTQVVRKRLEQDSFSSPPKRIRLVLAPFAIAGLVLLGLAVLTMLLYVLTLRDSVSSAAQ